MFTSQKLGGAVLAVTACLAAAAPSTAAVIGASDDNFIRQGSYANQVQGSGGTGQVIIAKNEGNTNSYTRKSYVKFDLAGGPVLADAPATFTFREADSQNSGTIRVYGLNAGFTPGGSELGTDWAEGAITWNNAPGNRTNHAYEMDATDTTLITSLSIVGSSPDGTEYSVPIATLADFLQSDNTVTLMVTAQSRFVNTFRIASSENTTYTGPQLEYSSIIPEPSTCFVWSLLAAIGLGWGAYRRKR